MKGRDIVSSQKRRTILLFFVWICLSSFPGFPGEMGGTSATLRGVLYPLSWDNRSGGGFRLTLQGNGRGEFLYSPRSPQRTGTPLKTNFQLDEEERVFFFACFDVLDKVSFSPADLSEFSPRKGSMKSNSRENPEGIILDRGTVYRLKERPSNNPMLPKEFWKMINDVWSQCELFHCLEQQVPASLQRSYFQPDVMESVLKSCLKSGKRVAYGNVQTTVVDALCELTTPEELAAFMTDVFDKGTVNEASNLLSALEYFKNERTEKLRQLTLEFNNLTPKERARRVVPHPRRNREALKAAVRSAATSEILQKSLSEMTSATTPYQLAGFLSSELRRMNEKKAWLLRSVILDIKLPPAYRACFPPILFLDLRDRIPENVTRLSREQQELVWRIQTDLFKMDYPPFLVWLMDHPNSVFYKEQFRPQIPQKMDLLTRLLSPRLESPDPQVRLRAMETLAPLIIQKMPMTPGMLRDYSPSLSFSEKLRQMQESDPDEAVRKKARDLCEMRTQPPSPGTIPNASSGNGR